VHKSLEVKECLIKAKRRTTDHTTSGYSRVFRRGRFCSQSHVRTVAAPPSIVVKCGGVVLRVAVCSVVLVVCCVVLCVLVVCLCVLPVSLLTVTRGRYLWGGLHLFYGGERSVNFCSRLYIYIYIYTSKICFCSATRRLHHLRTPTRPLLCVNISLFSCEQVPAHNPENTPPSLHSNSIASLGVFFVFSYEQVLAHHSENTPTSPQSNSTASLGVFFGIFL